MLPFLFLSFSTAFAQLMAISLPSFTDREAGSLIYSVLMCRVFSRQQYSFRIFLTKKQAPIFGSVLSGGVHSLHSNMLYMYPDKEASVLKGSVIPGGVHVFDDEVF